MNSPTPLLSVGLFVYNGERFLEEAFHSILNQSFSDFELIVSDNASTDRTREIAQNYAKHDHRIRYYRNEKNMGPGWNSRRVYELSTGKYFKLAAVDDVLEPDFLSKCVEALERHADFVVAYSRTKEVDEEGNFINFYTPQRTDSHDPIIRFRDMLMTGGSMCYQIFGVMRMSALHQLPPMGIHVNADGVLLARMSLLGRFYEVPEHLFISRRHSRQGAATLPARLKQPRRFRVTKRHSILPSPEWWNPAKTRALAFPEFRLLLEYFLSIYRAPLSIGQKLRCYSMLLPWIKMHFRPMLKDLLVAADQVIFNLQVPKQRSEMSNKRVSP